MAGFQPPGDNPVIRPLERLSYWVMGVRPDQEQNWRQYTWDSNRCVLGRWTHRWNQTDSLTLS